MKEKLKILLAISVVIITFMVVLFTFSRFRLQKDNHFVRVFPPHILGKMKRSHLTFNTYYLAGGTSEYFYLGNFDNPGRIKRFNYLLTDSLSINAQIPSKNGLIPIGLILKIDSPFAYMAGSLTANVYVGHIDSFEMQSLAHIPDFNDFLPLTNNTWVLRVLDTVIRQRILTKFIYSETQVENKGSFVLEKQKDGWFSTSGTIQFDRKINKIIYVHKYLNRIVCLDSNLNLLYRARTIDTTNNVNFEVVSIPSQKLMTLDKPSPAINLNMVVDQGLIFVQSALRATNEQVKSFQRSTVIDAYSLKDGSYHFSFYLPKENGKELKSFFIKNNRAIVLYDHALIIFDLSFPKI